VIVTDESVVKILDFGLAKLVGQRNITKDLTSLGTVNYMSPEQAQGEVVDDRTDIWSLGVLLYEAITGQFPFKGEYEQAVIYSIINQEPEPIAKYDRQIPDAVNRVLQKALQKKPASRYQTVLEMLEDLKEIKTSIEQGTPLPAVKSINYLKPAVIVFVVVFSLFFLLYQFWPTVIDRSLQKSITVLPFENLNADVQNEYFSNGMTEDIIVQLSKITDLRVISFLSSRSYINSGMSAGEIGKELGVGYILTGKVRREKNLIRITAQLIETESAAQLWAETYDRQLSEIFNIQSEVAQKISNALEINISDEEENRLNKTYTDDLSAYDYYLRGRNYYHRMREEDNETAIFLYKNALKKDSNFALAHSGLADAYVQKTLRFGENATWLDSAVSRSDFALTIDPNLAEAHKSLGLIYYTRSWFDKSLIENQKALELNPNYDIAMHNLGWIYLNLGVFEQAEHWLLQSRDVNPTFASTFLGLGLLKINQTDYNNALRFLEDSFDLQPDLEPSPKIASVMIDMLAGNLGKAEAKISFLSGVNPADVGLHIVVGDVFLQAGNPSAASESYQKALQINPKAWHPFTGINATTSLGFILWKTNHPEEAQEMLDYSLQLDDQTLAQGSQWWGIPYDKAAIYAIKGDIEQSYHWLEQAVNDGFRLYRWLAIDPLFENLRDQKKFKELLTAIKSKI
jgi:TolB-like protein/Flp pilus assembly protein TadD